MNVFYRGIPNPVDISVGGVAESDVAAQISSGNIKRVSAGTYQVRPGAGKETQPPLAYMPMWMATEN